MNAVLALDAKDAGAWLALARVRQRLGEERVALEPALRALELLPEEQHERLEALALDWDQRGSRALAEELRIALRAR